MLFIIIIFLIRHFLFTFHTSAVGCIVQPQHTAKNQTAEISAPGIAMGTMAIRSKLLSCVI